MSRTADGAPALLAIAAIAALIGWVAPFDVFYTAATGDSPLRRAIVIALVALAGGMIARKAGLSLAGTGQGAPWRIGLLWALLVALWVLALDCLLFRDRLVQGYVGFLHAPLHVRLFYFMLRAFNENVIYRLFAFGAVAWALRRWRPGAGLPALLGAAALVQAVNIVANVVIPGEAPVTAATLGYDALRYVTPGVVWAWLFVRHGFATAEVASVGCHLFLQPGFSLLLDR